MSWQQSCQSTSSVSGVLGWAWLCVGYSLSPEEREIPGNKARYKVGRPGSTLHSPSPPRCVSFSTVSCRELTVTLVGTWASESDLIPCKEVAEFLRTTISMLTKQGPWQPPHSVIRTQRNTAQLYHPVFFCVRQGDWDGWNLSEG